MHIPITLHELLYVCVCEGGGVHACVSGWMGGWVCMRACVRGVGEGCMGEEERWLKHWSCSSSYVFVLWLRVGHAIIFMHAAIACSAIVSASVVVAYE